MMEEVRNQKIKDLNSEDEDESENEEIDHTIDEVEGWDFELKL